MTNIWESENRPIMRATISRPCTSSKQPKVNRGIPITGSRPTVHRASPMAPPSSPLAILPGNIAASVDRPKSPIQKKASEPNFRAMTDSGSKNSMSTMVPKMPPRTEASRAM